MHGILLEGKTIFYSSNVPPVLNVRNNVQAIEDVDFIDYMGDNFNYNHFEKWASAYTVGAAVGSPVTYQTGWYVTHRSKFYKCKQVATQIEPETTPGWENYWELLLFSGHFFPADDVRASVGSFYNLKGMGLLDNPVSSPLFLKWSFFSAHKEEQTVQLSWGATFSDNLTKYIIERSTGGPFVKIGEVEPSESSFVDKFPSKTNQYRIRAVLEGERNYISEIRMVVFFSSSYPERVVIYNSVGQRVAKFESLEAFRSSDLTEGVYILQFADGHTLKFLKTKKFF